MKRLFDLIGAGVGLILLLPLLLYLAWRIRSEMGSPVLFRQTRPGKNGEPFEMVKFRSMRVEIESGGEALSDAERLTPFGRKLRATSLDELPELWNVLKGEMSLVGPRPLLMEYLPLYSAKHRRRMEVRPGVTGWAQVNGRNSISWNEKFALDIWYVDNQTIWLDMKIVVVTLHRIFTKDGISAEGEATMPKYTGSE